MTTQKEEFLQIEKDNESISGGTPYSTKTVYFLSEFIQLNFFVT